MSRNLEFWHASREWLRGCHTCLPSGLELDAVCCAWKDQCNIEELMYVNHARRGKGMKTKYKGPEEDDDDDGDDDGPRHDHGLPEHRSKEHVWKKAESPCASKAEVQRVLTLKGIAAAEQGLEVGSWDVAYPLSSHRCCGVGLNHGLGECGSNAASMGSNALMGGCGHGTGGYGCGSVKQSDSEGGGGASRRPGNGGGGGGGGRGGGGGEESMDRQSSMVQCPVCRKMMPAFAFKVHDSRFICFKCFFSCTNQAMPTVLEVACGSGARPHSNGPIVLMPERRRVTPDDERAWLKWNAEFVGAHEEKFKDKIYWRYSLVSWCEIQMFGMYQNIVNLCRLLKGPVPCIWGVCLRGCGPTKSMGRGSETELVLY
jgi:hypothetical protein